MPNIPLENPAKLRQLAAWYRDYAERAIAPWVCEGRLQTAEDLERRATLLEAGEANGRRARSDRDARINSITEGNWRRGCPLRIS